MESLWRHFKHSKTTRDACLGQDLSIHVNHSAIHLVTQSLAVVVQRARRVIGQYAPTHALSIEMPSLSQVQYSTSDSLCKKMTI
jgi:hypothetical protein